MMTSLTREQLFPWLYGLVGTTAIVVAHQVYAVQIPHSEGYKSAILALGGIFAGFMATLNALLFAMSDVAFARLKDSGYLKDLIRYLREAIWSSLLLCLVTCAAFWMPDDWWYIEALIGGLIVFTSCAIFRISTVSTYILANRS
jgi:hypothetical protein